MNLVVRRVVLRAAVRGSLLRLNPRGPNVRIRVSQTPIYAKLQGRSSLVIRVGTPGPEGQPGKGLRGDPGPPGLGFPSDLLANCLPTDAVGDFVYITADEVAGKIQVSKVDIDDVLKMPAVGMIISKTGALDCIVRRVGDVAMGGLIFNRVYWIGLSGKAVHPRPPDPVSGIRMLQRAGRAMTSTRLSLEVLSDMTKVIPPV